MSEALDALARYLGETCADCGTPGSQRHLSAVDGCDTCAASDPRPAAVPVRELLGLPDDAVLAYDMVLPPYKPHGIAAWAPFRNRLPRATKCYRLASGAAVHIKPECRCSR